METAPRHDSRNLQELLAAHEPLAVQQRLEASPVEGLLRDFIYGAIDGAVTTFAVASGVAGAGLSPQIIVILGVANLLGDGFSMAAGNYLGTRAQLQHREKLRRMEERHIEQVPDGEREEVRQIFARYGFSAEELERIVTVVTSDRDRWLEMMLREEHGLAQVQPSPIRAATATFIAFVCVGALPLLPFVWQLLGGIPMQVTYVLSTVITAMAFFLVGSIKARFVDEHWLWSGIETLLVGGTAAALSYICGDLLGSLWSVGP